MCRELFAWCNEGEFKMLGGYHNRIKFVTQYNKKATFASLTYRWLSSGNNWLAYTVRRCNKIWKLSSVIAQSVRWGIRHLAHLCKDANSVIAETDYFGWSTHIRVVMKVSKFLWLRIARWRKWKHFPRYWHFVRGIHRWPVNSPHKGQWRGAFMLSLICTKINGWVNNGEAGDLRRHRAHYDVTVMSMWKGRSNIELEWNYVFYVLCTLLLVMESKENKVNHYVILVLW